MLTIVFIALSILFNVVITVLIQCQLYRQYWEYILYMLKQFTLYISEFSVQSTLYNQPAETTKISQHFKTKKISLQQFLTHSHEVIQLLWSASFQIYMFKITKSVGVMKEGILMEFHLLYLVQKCQTVNMEKIGRHQQK